MRRNRTLYFLIFFIVLNSCSKEETAVGIIQKTIDTIDTIETIYYKQDMSRSNPQNVSDTIYRYREMYFTRLITDSIVGVKGHWYMYLEDKKNVVFEDIYDGNRLIRKNNRDSIAILYDLVKYPEIKQKHFWGHNTLYGMQYEFRYMLDNKESYSIERLNDTIIDGKDCYQIIVSLENKMTIPGYLTKLDDNKGSVSRNSYYMNKETNYPIRMKGENYSIENPEQRIFMEQRYYDIKFNHIVDEEAQFNTSDRSIIGYEKREGVASSSQ